MSSSLRGKRVLIVEDEVVTGELLRSCVEREAGIPLGPAPSGQSAMDLMSRERPHAALLDVSLLDGSSVRVARHLETCGVPYAVLAGHAADSRPIELQAAPCLEKPIAPRLLIAMLARLMGHDENDLFSRAIPVRKIVVVSAAIVLAGVAGWFLHQAASDFDMAHEVTDARLALRQEHEKSQQLERLLADALQQASANAVATADATALQQQVTYLGKALKDERVRSGALSLDLDAARRENETQAAAFQKADDKPDTGKQLAEAQQALQQEQSKSEALTRALATARRENETQAAALQKANDKPDTSKQLAETRQALQDERTRAEGLARDLAALRQENETQAVALEKATAAQIASVASQAEAPARMPSAPPLPAADPETRRLMGHAQQLIEQRNIIAARSMLERAAESGHPSALFALAETYDPNQLAAWGTVGTQGDPAQARELYQKALAGGMTEAQARLTTLQP